MTYFVTFLNNIRLLSSCERYSLQFVNKIRFPRYLYKFHYISPIRATVCLICKAACTTGLLLNPKQYLRAGYACRIKTCHSNLVSCFGTRMRALAKVFYRGESRGKIPCQRPNPRDKTWHKNWMNGLNPNYDTMPILSLQNSQNKYHKSSFTYDRRHHLTLPLPPVHPPPPPPPPNWTHAPVDDVTIFCFRSNGQFESLVNINCQRIIMWIISAPIMHIE